jgi:DNA-binding NtrC family response regulator
MVAKGILRDAHLHADICVDLAELIQEIRRGADAAIVTEEAIRGGDVRELVGWVASQPAWSDFPFVLLTEHGGGIERNPAAARMTETLGNVTFIERPFHPTTLVSVVLTSLRGRRRQYEGRRLNEELESRVQERTAELAAANRQLLAQIEERERVESTLRQMQRLEAVGQSPRASPTTSTTCSRSCWATSGSWKKGSRRQVSMGSCPSGSATCARPRSGARS